MKMQFAVVGVCLFLTGLSSVTAESMKDSAKPSNSEGQGSSAYLGEPVPGEKPVIFAPEFLSARYHFVARLAFSPDGTECYFTVTDATFAHPKILWTRLTDGVWSEPIQPSFADSNWKNHEPFISHDGTKLYFTSDRQAQPATNRRDFWVVERTSSGWSEPTRLPAPINSDFTEFFFCQGGDGTIYFSSNRPGGSSQLDIYRVRQIPGQPAQAENLGPVINGGIYNGDACIAPDGRFLVFGTVRMDGRGGMDLYVTFPNGSGGWTAPTSLGNEFNTSADEYGPTLSPDQKYLFFTRHDGTKADVNWVQASVLEKIRSAVLPEGK
ncbi:MAG: hypothetical protein WAU88_04370 [Candidatus Zixiibacteriota bacterium]